MPSFVQEIIEKHWNFQKYKIHVICTFFNSADLKAWILTIRVIVMQTES